jgi:hypothetical protein
MAATLYRVQTRTDAIEGYDDVLITWAAEGRTAPVEIPQHVGGLRHGIPHHLGRSTVLSHEGDTRPSGAGRLGP